MPHESDTGTQVEPTYASLHRLLTGEELTDPYRSGLRALTELRPVLARLEAALVDGARLAGATWGELARDLGTSRPTVQRRHAPIAEQRRRRHAAWNEIFDS